MIYDIIVSANVVRSIKFVVVHNPKSKTSNSRVTEKYNCHF